MANLPPNTLKVKNTPDLGHFIVESGVVPSLIFHCGMRPPAFDAHVWNLLQYLNLVLGVSKKVGGAASASAAPAAAAAATADIGSVVRQPTLKDDGKTSKPPSVDGDRLTIWRPLPRPSSPAATVANRPSLIGLCISDPGWRLSRHLPRHLACWRTVEAGACCAGTFSEDRDRSRRLFQTSKRLRPLFVARIE